MKDYFFYLFRSDIYDIEYLDSLTKDEIKQYFIEQSTDKKTGNVVMTDYCLPIPLDEICELNNNGTIDLNDWWMFLVEV